jgi:hypothetical protein
MHLTLKQIAPVLVVAVVFVVKPPTAETRLYRISVHGGPIEPVMSTPYGMEAFAVSTRETVGTPML